MCPEARDWCYSSSELGYECPNPNSFHSVFETLSSFARGDVFLLGLDYRRLKKANEQTWEIKIAPPDSIRVFGWFYNSNVFIATHCEFRNNLKEYKSYTPHKEKIKQTRKDLGVSYHKGLDLKQNEKEYTHIKRRSS